jgi:ribosomal protein S14
VTRLAEPSNGDWLRTMSLEARIVAYADKRAAQHLEPMEERFVRWRRKYPPGSNAPVRRSGGTAWTEDTFALAEARARDLEQHVCALAGTTPAAVRRFRWSRRALRETGVVSDGSAGRLDETRA